MMKKLLGNIAETAVIHKLALMGLPVFKEIGDSVSVDLITLVEKKPIMIQVKYGRMIDCTVSAMLKKTGPNNYVYYYTVNDFDVLAVYVPMNGDILWISSTEALSVNTTQLTFRYGDSKNNQRNGIRRAERYLDFCSSIGRAGLF